MAVGPKGSVPIGRNGHVLEKRCAKVTGGIQQKNYSVLALEKGYRRRKKRKTNMHKGAIHLSHPRTNGELLKVGF